MAVLLAAAVWLGFSVFATSTSDGFIYVNASSGITITSYKGNAKDVTVPDAINGKTVVKINSFAFDKNTVVKSIVIPSGVKILGDGVFRGCTALTSVTLPSSVITIGSYIFDGCDSVMLICDRSSNANYYAQRYGIPFIFSDSSEVSTSFEYTTKDKYIIITKYIGTGGIVTIPAEIDGVSVRYIGDYAFSNVHNVISVNIPNSVRSIGIGAFMQCYDLNAINVEGDNYFYTSVDGILFSLDESTLIQYPTAKLGSVYAIPLQVHTIGYAAFRGCKLSSVTVPSNVQQIDHYAFADCSLLSVFNISDSTLHIGRDILINTPWYMEQNNGIVYIGRVAYCCKGNVMDYSLKADTIALAAYLFDGCTFSSFDIPSTVKVIGYGALLNCKLLVNITLPSSLTYIESHAFGGCTSLTDVIFTNSTCTIMAGAFIDCFNPAFTCEPGSTAEIFASKYGNPIAGGLRVPVVVVTSISSTSISIKWNVILGATGYKIYLNGKCITSTPITSVSDTITKLTNGKTYNIQVSAVNLSSESALSIAKIVMTGTAVAGNGDVNCDGNVNVADVLYLFQYLSGKRSLTNDQLLSSDYNGDTIVNIADLMLIFKKISGR